MRGGESGTRMKENINSEGSKSRGGRCRGKEVERARCHGEARTL